MKATILSLIVVLSVWLNSSVKTNKMKQNQPVFPKVVVYEIFIQSWADSNGDGIGDINGATQKLDYLSDLGVGAVWLMPIMPSPSYHKYDVTDYRSIHPDYGTMDDFKRFIHEAHSRNIKVIIDMVINHTSNKHPWFLQAKSTKNSPYRDYYVWADKDSIEKTIKKKEVTLDSDNITQWHPVEGKEDEEHYYGFFWGGMPDLNFDSPSLRNEIIDIGKYWLQEVGVDGFRLDAAKHIYPDDRMKDSYEFWQYYKKEMQLIKEDVYLLGEVWAPSQTVALFASGLSALFNFDLAESIHQSVLQERNTAVHIKGTYWKQNKSNSLVSSLIEHRKMVSNYNSNFQDAIFLSNHDQNRILSNFNGSAIKAKLAASILLTLPGTPFIYYGEEIGMLGKKPDPRIREPFIWTNANDSSRSNWLQPLYNTDQNIKGVEQQLSDSSSILNHYKKWISIRNTNNALDKGEIYNVKVGTEKLLAYKREAPNQSLLVVHNLSSQQQLLPEYSKIILIGKENLVGNSEKKYIKPFSTVIFIT